MTDTLTIVQWVAKNGPLARRLKKLGPTALEQVINAAVERLIRDGEFATLPDDSPEQLTLVGRALNAERMRYIRKSPHFAGPGDGEHGSSALEPSAILEREEAKQEAESDQARWETVRPIEDENFKTAIVQLAATLKPKEKYALDLLLQRFSNAAIYAATRKCFGRGLDRPKIMALRKQLTALANRWLTIAPEVPKTPESDVPAIPTAPPKKNWEDTNWHDSPMPMIDSALASYWRADYSRLTVGDMLYSPTGPIPRPRSAPATPEEIAEFIKAHGVTTERPIKARAKPAELIQAEARRTQLRASQHEIKQKVRKAEARVAMIKSAEKLGISAESVLALEAEAEAAGLSLDKLLTGAIKPRSHHACA